MKRIADVLWLRVPAAVRRFSLTLSMIFADGGYLRAWPPLAVLTPVAGCAMGLFLGAIYAALTDGTLYTYSSLVVVLMALFAALGAGIGFATWTGFVLADLVFTDRSPLPGFYPYFSDGLLTRLTRGYIPLLLAYALLFGLLVLAPLMARVFALRTERLVRASRPNLAIAAGGGVYVLVLAGLAYGWAQAVPFMVRPLWSFSGDVPDTAAVQPVPDHAGVLTILIGLAAAGRVVAAALAERRTGGAPAPMPPRKRSAALRFATPPLQALALTLMLAGLIANLPLGILFSVFMLGILAIRVVVMPMIPGYAAAVNRIPLLPRIGACVLVCYALADVAVEPAWQRGDHSFTGLLVTVVLSLLVSMVVLPGQPLWTPGAARQAVVDATPSDPVAGGGPDAAVLGVAGIVAAALAVPVRGSSVSAGFCSGLADCTSGASAARTAAGITLMLLAVVLLPEILEAGAAAQAAETADAAAKVLDGGAPPDRPIGTGD